MILFTRNSFCGALIATATTFDNGGGGGGGGDHHHAVEQLQQLQQQQQQLEEEEEEEEMAIMASAAKFIRTQVNDYLQYDPTMSGPILRLAFHDATVRDISSNPNIGGANGSIRFELEWSENRGLSKPMKVIQNIYEAQKNFNSNINNNNGCRENSSNTNGSLSSSSSSLLSPSSSSPCQKILSFADVLALAGAETVERAGGPSIPIKLGRNDKTSSDEKYFNKELLGAESERSIVKTTLPSAGLDSLGLRIYFRRLGLTDMELVALMGAHDLGRHVTLTGMSKDCLRNLTRTCLEDAPTLVPFVSKTKTVQVDNNNNNDIIIIMNENNPDTFSNGYFQSLLRWNDRTMEFGEAAFIPTDVALVVDEGLREYVERFANDEEVFFQTFRTAYQKLVDSTGTSLMSY